VFGERSPGDGLRVEGLNLLSGPDIGAYDGRIATSAEESRRKRGGKGADRGRRAGKERKGKR
jgi:hypothetical protein